MFGNQYCSQIRKKRGNLGDMWYLDEAFIKINGVLYYLRRAVYQDRDELDILVQKGLQQKGGDEVLQKVIEGPAGNATKNSHQ